MAGTATLVRVLKGWNGEARLYSLSEPMRTFRDEGETSHVVVSAVVAYSGPETLIFACGKDGDQVDFGDLSGSFRGAMDHEEALRRAGYAVSA